MYTCVLNYYSRVRLFVTPWIVAHQAPLSMGFSRQECWSGLPLFLQGIFPDPGIERMPPGVSCIASGFFVPGALGEGILALDKVFPHSSLPQNACHVFYRLWIL